MRYRFMYVIVLRLHNITHSYFKLAYSICSAHNTFSAPPIRPSDYIFVRRVRRTLNYRSRLNYTFSHLAKVRPRSIKRAKLLSRFSSIYTSSLMDCTFAFSHLRKLAHHPLPTVTLLPILRALGLFISEIQRVQYLKNL